MKTQRPLVITKALWAIVIGIALWAVIAVMTPNNAVGITAFARKYGVDCRTCHDPAVPRLNAFGHQFRKMGYRMDTEMSDQLTNEVKAQIYKEVGDYLAVRFRTGYSFEEFRTRQPAGDEFNSFKIRNGFWTPDVTIFFAGALTQNLSLFAELEFSDETEIQVFGQYVNGTPDHWLSIRLGQMHTLPRVGWAGFDRPTGITTPDALSSRRLTLSPVPFRINEDQRGIDFSYNFTPESRIIAGLYNGVNFGGHGNEGTGAGDNPRFGDNDNAKDYLLAYEQMIGQSGFTFYSYYGFWDQKANPDQGIFDDDSHTKFKFLRIGATGSWVFNIFPKDIGSTELQGGYIYAQDWFPNQYPVALEPGGKSTLRGHAFWVGAEQRLPFESAIFARFDYVTREEDFRDERTREILGLVFTYQQYLRLALEAFVYNQTTDSWGFYTEAMYNY
jgi:hypothetical protein